MIKFTLGPWKGKPTNDGKAIVFYSSSEEVCEVNTDDINENEGEANARLIAASPEMYSILSDILKDEGMMGDTLGKINNLLNKING